VDDLKEMRNWTNMRCCKIFISQFDLR